LNFRLVEFGAHPPYSASCLSKLKGQRPQATAKPMPQGEKKMKFGKKLFLGLMVAVLTASMLVSAALAAPAAAGCEEETPVARFGGGVLGFSLEFLLNFLIPTGAPSCIPEREECIGNGGTWIGADSPSPMSQARCMYEANSTGALAACQADEERVIVYTWTPSGFYAESGGGCDPVVGPGGGDEEEEGGEHEGEEEGETDSDSDAGTSSTPTERTGRDDDETDPALKTSTGDAGPQSFTTFDGDACPGWCTVNSSLPEKAAKSLPAGTNKTLYVRLVDENQDPYQGHYVACFNRSEVPNPVVYRFVEGVWIAVPAYSTSSTQICVSAFGDGSFALVNE
jgi:hypothetical protein